MINIAIFGNRERGKEVIDILRKIGGKDQPVPPEGTNPHCLYFIMDGYIVDSDSFLLDPGVVRVFLEDLDWLYQALKSVKE